MAGEGLEGTAGVVGPDWAEGCSFPRGWELEAAFQTPLPSQSRESPRVLLQHSSPSHGLAQAQGEHRPALFQHENRGTTVVPLLSSWLCWSSWALGSVQRSCSLFSAKGELPDGHPSVAPLDIPRHNLLRTPKQARHPR